MDQKLLQALNNVGSALESLVEAIESKQKSKSATTDAIKGGNFGKQLETISVELKSIKSDTQQILKNQETIISLSKEKEKEKTETIENAGSNNQKEQIKKGVGTILLIAGAVLAIGLAFKIVGAVDFLSVISLSLAITILAVAFERIAQMKDLNYETAAMASASLVMISIGLALSSIALSFMNTVGGTKLLTAIAISGIFVILSHSIEKMISAFKGRSLKEVGYSVLFLPVILPAIALGIAGASYAFQLVQPIGLSQFFSALMIGIIFTILSFGIKQILKSFKGIDPATAVVASFMIPILFTAVSFAILSSSEALSKVKMISLESFFGAILISAIFVVLSFGLKRMISAFKGIDPATAVTASLTIPILMVAISGAIWASSKILDEMTVVSEDKLKNAGLIGLGLSLLALVMVPTIKSLSKVSPTEIIKGALIIPALALIVMVSSRILNVGTYENYPGLDWIKGVSLSLLTFALGAFALGLSVSGPQAVIFAAGLGAVLVVAGTIVAVSKILSAGQYDNPGMLEWAKSTALLYAAFTPIMLILGTAALASAVVGVFGPDPWKMAQSAMLDVADTIVKVSYKLQEGNYSEGPTKEWAEGIAIALGAFSPVYGMLMKNAIFSIFGGGGVGPDDFTQAIKTVSQGILSAANFFASPENPGVWSGHPPEKWAKGVGLAIGAFAPVYEVLAANSGWFKSGVDVEDMKSAIITISKGIVNAAEFFADNKSPFEEGNYPSKKWGEGVGAALGAFSPVFDMLMDKSWYKSDKSVIDGMISGLVGISKGIISVAFIFSGASASFEYYPKESWSNSVKKSVTIFTDISKYIKEENAQYWRVGRVADRMVSVAKTLFSNSDIFSKSINPNFVSGLSKNMIDFNELIKELVGSESDESAFSRFGNKLFGNDPIIQIAKRMITLAEGYDALAKSLTGLGLAMKTLNITDVRMLGGLTREITSPSDISFNNKTSGGFDERVSSNKGSTSMNMSGSSSNKSSVLSSDEDLSSKFDEMIRILNNIDKSTGSVDSIINEIVGDEDAKKENGSFLSFIK